MRRIRATVLALSALLLFLTGQQMAVARGAMAAVETAVLCIGGHSVTVALDAEGKPTQPNHICLDCLVGSLAGADAAPLPIPLNSVPRQASVTVTTLPPPASRASPVRVRGPPVLL